MEGIFLASKAILGTYEGAPFAPPGACSDLHRTPSRPKDTQTAIIPSVPMRGPLGPLEPVLIRIGTRGPKELIRGPLRAATFFVGALWDPLRAPGSGNFVPAVHASHEPCPTSFGLS